MTALAFALAVLCALAFTVRAALIHRHAITDAFRGLGYIGQFGTVAGIAAVALGGASLIL